MSVRVRVSACVRVRECVSAKACLPMFVRVYLCIYLCIFMLPCVFVGATLYLCVCDFMLVYACTSVHGIFCVYVSVDMFDKQLFLCAYTYLFFVLFLKTHKCLF